MFSVYLPACDRPVIYPPAEDKEIFTGRGKILVMDDEKLLLQIMGEMLAHLGYEAEFSGNGDEAVELFTQTRASARLFDAVILDLTVPGGMGGKEALEQLLKIDSQVRAIVSSGYADAPIMADFRKFGFRGIIAKPYKIAELCKVLKEVLS